MTLTQIKSQLGIVSLDLVRGKDKDNKPTDWLRYWDNTNRVAVVVHQDVVAAIKSNPGLTTLALKSTLEYPKPTEEELAKPEEDRVIGPSYMNHILINAKSIEVSL